MKSPDPRTFQVKSFGCQMNVYDGERMAELLGQQGMRAAAEGDDADLVVLNTCHIREKAADKAYSDVGRLKREDGSKPLIALAGCVAQAEGAEAKRRSQLIDIVVGPQGVMEVATLTGTNSGPWAGAEATGLPVSLQVLILFPWDPATERFLGERIWFDRGTLGTAGG